MPRRTKDEAEITRGLLLDAAERVFQVKGVAATSLADIAQEARLSRGAIYWHFRDKDDLYNAMLQRVSLPLELAFHRAALAGADSDPLLELRRAFAGVLHQVVTDPQTRRVLEVVTQKVEYGDAHSTVRTRHLQTREVFVRHIQRGLVASARWRGSQLASPLTAARGLHALLDGLVQNWILQPDGFDLKKVGNHSIEKFLQGLGLRTPPGTRTRQTSTPRHT